MKILEFSYKDENWELKNLELGSVSLIVGKNATGKSRTLFHLNNLVKLLKQVVSLLPDGTFDIKLELDGKQHLSYHLEIQDSNRKSGKVKITEVLKVNNRIVLDRSLTDAKILNTQYDKLEPINPPANKLAIHVNRDVKKYPFLEDLFSWAEHSYSFRFASITSDFHNVNWETGINLLDDIPALFNALNSSDKAQVISDLLQIGFFIEHLDIKKGTTSDLLQIKEKEISHLIDEYELSQGMLRSLYLVIFIRFLISNRTPSSIVIDDLCEGLDYDRATKLGELIFSICKKSHIQLIASSNDMFLMDVVDLEYWNVLQRKGGVVTALNAKNHPALFESFKFTGLSNFDFFSSDFIPQKIEK